MDEKTIGIPETDAIATPDAKETKDATPKAEAEGTPEAAQPEAEPKDDSQSDQEAADQAAPANPSAGNGNGAESRQEEAQSDPLAQANEKLAFMTEKLLTACAQAEAAKLSIPENRVPYVLRMADLNGIDPTAEDAAGMVREVLEKVVADVPELRGGGTGSPGAFRRKVETPMDAFERGFRNG